jgi:hypothetical protein
MAYWLLEADRCLLHKKRGFSSLGDYARELTGVNPRKVQYLVFIADRLEKLPGSRPWSPYGVSGRKARKRHAR